MIQYFLIKWRPLDFAWDSQQIGKTHDEGEVEQRIKCKILTDYVMLKSGLSSRFQVILMAKPVTVQMKSLLNDEWNRNSDSDCAAN